MNLFRSVVVATPADAGAARRGIMSCRGQAFFETWVEGTLAPRLASTVMCPTPLSLMAELRADAAAAGLSEDELRSGVGDLCEAIAERVMRMSEAAGTMSMFDGDARPCVTTPAGAMQIAISYLDGVRDVVSSDVALAADLVLCSLAKQGYRLTPWNGESSLRAIVLDSRGQSDVIVAEPAALHLEQWKHSG